MCIRENVLYLCGHSSVSVTRVCPMTTQYHEYPACKEQPVNTHVARTMCGACERVKHSRWVLIQEWEHRWMHERGACGCDTVFPGLVGPRVARPANGDYPPEKMDKTFIPPQFRYVEATPTGMPGGAPGGEPLRVEIRLPSVYGAEWIKDHEVLHREGRCQCPVNFERYKAAVPQDQLNKADVQTLDRFHYLETLDGQRDANEITIIRNQLGVPFPVSAITNGTMLSTNIMPSFALPNNSTASSLSGTTPPASRDSEKTMVGAPPIVDGSGAAKVKAEDFDTTSAANNHNSGLDVTPNLKPASSDVQYMTPNKPAGDHTYLSPAYQGTSGEGPLPSNAMRLNTPGTFVHVQSASEPQTPSYMRAPDSSNNYIETTGNSVPGEIKVPDELPLVGLPIGAGPEGLPFRQPHAGDFAECSLRQGTPRRSVSK